MLLIYRFMACRLPSTPKNVPRFKTIIIMNSFPWPQSEWDESCTRLGEDLVLYLLPSVFGQPTSYVSK